MNDRSAAKRKYINTLCMLYIEAASSLLDKPSVLIEYSINKGIYTQLRGIVPDNVLLERLREKIRELISRRIPIITKTLSTAEAITIFEAQGMTDKVQVLRSAEVERVTLCRLTDTMYCFLGGVLENSGDIDQFSLIAAEDGIILAFPFSNGVLGYRHQEKLFAIFRESEDWARLLEINHAGDLNEVTRRGELSDIVRISEALHEKKIAQIADSIHKKSTARLILIAGPSSSGKTTFAKRLGIQLRVLGKKFITVGLDDYFVDRDQTPLGADGKPDFDSIAAVDVAAFNADLQKLLRGEEVILPSFDFIRGVREYRRPPIKLSPDTYLLVEGIHGLNEELTASIPSDRKFKVYISALTQLNIDEHNRIATTDLRLLRRMVRDIKTRGYDAERTLELWTNVVKGENINIFPFQENADILFNSSLIYELAFLKKHALSVLGEVRSDSPYYEEALRLSELLAFFRGAEDELAIPNTSILREFIGGSCFEH